MPIITIDIPAADVRVLRAYLTASKSTSFGLDRRDLEAAGMVLTATVERIVTKLDSSRNDDQVDYVVGESRSFAANACEAYGINPQKAVGARSAWTGLEGTQRARVLLVDPWTDVRLYQRTGAILDQVQAQLVTISDLAKVGQS